MAVCALASARARDGAIYSARWSYDQVKDPPSEVFFEQAAKSMPVEKMTARDHSLNAMRACAFLAITSIQYGQIRSMHQYLGRYHALVSMDALHNEVNWPRDIGFVEIEERRRLVRLPFLLKSHKSQTLTCGRFSVLVPLQFRHLLIHHLGRHDAQPRRAGRRFLSDRD